MSVSSVAEAYQEERVRPWESLPESEYVIEADRVTSVEMRSIRRRLEERGIAVLRLEGLGPEAGILTALAASLGPMADEQNSFGGTIKEIEPSRGVEATTGDSAFALGPHVDGTQHGTPPALLLFQYVRGATYGAQSQFWDGAGVLASFPESEREALLTTLARPDAARFRKGTREHVGPMVWLPRRGSAAFRLRFDEVIEVHPECREAFETLRARFARRGLEYLPRTGDIVVFDNWRLLHGRREVGGDAPRRHRRVWIQDLFPELKPELKLGLRPLEPETLVALRARFRLKPQAQESHDEAAGEKRKMDVHSGSGRAPDGDADPGAGAVGASRRQPLRAGGAY